MATTDNFTIDLVSNGSMDVFPKNALSKFENQIDPALELDGDWEVALTEIYFPLQFAGNTMDVKIIFGSRDMANYGDIQVGGPMSFQTGLSGELSVSIDDSTAVIASKLNELMKKVLQSPSAVQKRGICNGTVKSYPEFIINDDKMTFKAGVVEIAKHKSPSVKIVSTAKDAKEKWPFLYQSKYARRDKKLEMIEGPVKDSNKAYVYYDTHYLGHVETVSGDQEWEYTAERIIIPHFNNPDILPLLGFTESMNDFLLNLNLAKREKTVLASSYSKNVFLMYVYTDIIRDHNVGGTKAPVLRTVPLSAGIYAGIGYATFEHRIYYPIRKNHIESIAVLLLDDTGEQIKFANIGRVFLSLDFRRKRN